MKLPIVAILSFSVAASVGFLLFAPVQKQESSGGILRGSLYELVAYRGNQADARILHFRGTIEKVDRLNSLVFVRVPYSQKEEGLLMRFPLREPIIREAYRTTRDTPTIPKEVQFSYRKKNEEALTPGMPITVGVPASSPFAGSYFITRDITDSLLLL